MKRLLLAVAAFAIAATSVLAQDNDQSYVHPQSPANGYIYPEDPAVLAKLNKWQDLKFGVLMHWGIYSVPGIVESWSICSEDWIRRPYDKTYEEYKQWYYSLADSLNPVHFNPEQWAQVMEDAGMKYMIFTTKHHDGFCTFDSKYDDFSIANGPAHINAAKEVFDAFRNHGFWAGCYFSKPDWHCKYYWSPYYATADRNQNYNRDQHPDWWQNYVTFTQNQIRELMTDYGKFDMLWLDGGWVTGDMIGLDGLLKEIRSTTQPGLIAVDRASRSKNENYQTPERGVPQTQLNYPWESCITLSNDWGWTPNAKYKTARKVIDILTEITAKGGCLVLGVGPTADGLIEGRAVDILEEIGTWMKANGKAIYNTITTPVYNDGNVWFTADKDGKTLYAIYALPDGESLPETIKWNGNVPVGKVTVLSTGKTIKATVADGTVSVKLPKGTAEGPVALSFSIK